MGLWDTFRRKRKKVTETDIWDTGDLPASQENKPDLEQEEVSTIYKSDQLRYVSDCLESIADNEQQIQSAKKEYQQVTEKLTDIQLIERIHGESQVMLQDYCKKIEALVQERNQYKNRNLTITDSQIRYFDQYEVDLVDEIKKMYQAEIYQKAIDGDMMHLEQEKKSLQQERHEIVEKQNALKSMAKVLCGFIAALVVLFVALNYSVEVDMTMPYLGTMFLTAISATVIFVEANRNRRDMIMAERKLNKAIGLLNRVKIKYVNNTNALEYNRHKFHVKDGAEFESLWGEYCRAKEYERKFRENTEVLSATSDEMVEMLKEYQLHDPEVWLGQCEAILDQREMVEIRHNLNQRRQKLRDRIQYNTEIKESMLQKIDTLIQEYPERKAEVLKMVRAQKETED